MDFMQGMHETQHPLTDFNQTLFYIQ